MIFSLNEMPKTIFKSDDYGISVEQFNGLSPSERSDFLGQHRAKRNLQKTFTAFIQSFNCYVYPEKFVAMTATLDENILTKLLHIFAYSSVPLQSYAKYADPRNKASAQFYVELTQIDFSNAKFIPATIDEYLNKYVNDDANHEHFDTMLEKLKEFDNKVSEQEFAQILASALVLEHRTIQQTYTRAMYDVAQYLNYLHSSEKRKIQSDDLLNIVTAITSLDKGFPYV